MPLSSSSTQHAEGQFILHTIREGYSLYTYTEKTKLVESAKGGLQLLHAIPCPSLSTTVPQSRPSPCSLPLHPILLLPPELSFNGLVLTLTKFVRHTRLHRRAQPPRSPKSRTLCRRFPPSSSLKRFHALLSSSYPTEKVSELPREPNKRARPVTWSSRASSQAHINPSPPPFNEVSSLHYTQLHSSNSHFFLTH